MASPKTRIHWPVLVGSSSIIIAISIWAILWPTGADSAISNAVAWAASNFGWYYILTAAVVTVFVIALAFSSAGRIKLGPIDSTPHFSLTTWAAMLFAAGIGIDLMFFAVSEPVAQYMLPPAGAGETIEAARQAVVWTLFHYGPVGWAMYALMGGAFAFFTYRRGMPLSLRSIIRPVIGSRAEGPIGHTIDIVAILGTVFGIAVTLGIGVVQLTYGMHLLFGLPEDTGVHISLISLAVLIATISTVSGVDKGIRRLSELNVILAGVLLAWILITGETRRLLDGLVMNIGDFAARFPGMLMETYAWEQPDQWMQAWTLFFWAWWFAWAPFVGLFLARISRGRSLRQFIITVLTVPFAFIAIFVSLFGNSSLVIVMGGDREFADTAINHPEHAFFDLLSQYPGAPALLAIALVSGLLFYVTSADSGALVLANLTSVIDSSHLDGPRRLRIFWSITTGVLTLAMLVVGGVSALQQATLILGLPLSLLIYLVMFAFYRALRTELSATHLQSTL